MNLDPYGLQRFAAKSSSQFAEDGITLELVSRLKPPRFAIEIGAGTLDPIENNTYVLAQRGWMCLWYDPRLIGVCPENVIVCPWKVYADNVPGMGWRLGVLSIDVDGNDYWLWQASTRAPSIVIVECNIERPLEVEYVMPYDPDHVSTPGHTNYGASLASMIKLGGELGYEFVGMPPDGSVNAFFVRNDLMEKIV